MQQLKIAPFLQDLGYGSTFNSNVILAVLEQLQIYPANAPMRITAQEIGAVLSMMAKTHSQLNDNPTLHALTSGMLDENSQALLDQMQTWNLELFFPLMKKLNPNLDWAQVLICLDHPDTTFYDAHSLAIVLKASKAVIQDMSTFPTNVFLDRWKNRKAQIGFLTQAVQIAPEVFTLSKYISRHVVSKDTIPLNNATRFFFNSCIQSCWNSMELCELLVDYSESFAPGESSAGLVELGLEQSPDLLLLAFSSISAPWSGLIKDLGPKLVLSMLAGHIHAQFVLPRVCELNPTLFINGLLLMYNTEKATISRILDITQEMKILAQVLESKQFQFAIELAALASRREYLNLEKWLQDRLSVDGEPFLRACLEFLNEKVINAQNGRPDGLPTVPLSLEVTTTFLRILHANGGKLSPENAEFREKVFTACSQLLPRLEAPSGQEEVVAEGASFPPEIEEEANAFYEKIYKGELSISEVVDLLQRLKLSQMPREQETFKCMIHNLFDEYKFFSRYPDRELLITSVLFGVLIQNQIVTAMALGVALRYVLEALRQPVGSKLFQFGIQALAQFQSRLAEWPQYCSLILQIDHLHQTHPEVIHLIQTVQKQGMGVSPPDQNRVMQQQQQQQQLQMPVRVNDGSLFSALQLHGIIQDRTLEFETPSELIQEKILFVINNVTLSNVEAKVLELSDILLNQHVRWFCNYIVVKRVSIEPNFHSTYSVFLSTLSSKFVAVTHAIIFETLSSIKDLVNSEKTVNSSQERSYLKNLGSWLGSITLAKNKPIKHKNIAFKQLLMEGYEHKRLIVVIPFVCKVLEQCGSSKVFNPPNPWIMGIMRLLAELYHFAELKLNLKFEIEVLCKNIKLDIKDVTPSESLRSYIQNAGSRESEQRTMTRADSASNFTALNDGKFNVATSNFPPLDESSGIGYPNLSSFITFNPNITLFNSQPSLKRIVHIAIDRSIREAIQSPVLDRSVSIAVVATREIVIKDFSLEVNEDRMRKAAQYMVQSLAGSLASVSSRETLKISMISNLRSLLIANGFTEQTVPEQIVFVIVSDNLDLACSVMEKAAAEKSIPEIEDSLAPACMNRRKHREQRNGQAFYDPLAYTSSHYLSALPEFLRLKSTGVSPQQMRVYEDFMRIPHGGAAVSSPTEGTRPVLARQEMRPPPPSVQPSNPDPSAVSDTVISLEQVVEKAQSLVADLDRLLQENANVPLQSLNAQHPVKVAVHQLFWLISQSGNPDESCLIFSEKIVNSLFLTDSILAREVYILVLRRLVDFSKPLASELTEWFMYNTDPQKYNVDVTIAILRADILTCLEVDLHICRQLETTSDVYFDFVIEFLTKCCLGDTPLYSYVDFLYSYESLRRIPSSKRPSIQKFMDVMHSKSSLTKVAALASDDAATAKDDLVLLFKEWFTAFCHPASNESLHRDFASKLVASGLTKNEALFSRFVRIATEISIESFNSIKMSGATAGNPYQAVDSFSRLIVHIIRNDISNPAYDETSQSDIVNNAASVIVLVLVHMQEVNPNDFDQKPFLRLFSSILNDLKHLEIESAGMYRKSLSIIAEMFHALRPGVVPSFAFSWIQLISHRNFLPCILLADGQKYWPYYHNLLCDLLEFVSPFLSMRQLTPSSRMLYRSTLRTFLILLHDFPDFLSGYHLSLVNLLPPTCIQIRNLILSAFPPEMRLPDPFTPNLKMDSLPEMKQPPQLLFDYTQLLSSSNLKQDLDVYLKTRSPASTLQILGYAFLSKSPNTGVKFDSSLINAVVLYVGAALSVSLENNLNLAVDMFQQLLNDLDSEGRYIFLGAIANQLRFPNSHTYFFSRLLLELFSKSSSAIMKEHITRVLIERLIVSRPHPYGLLVTFIELIRNQQYHFWDNSHFINAAPEIETLFTNVAKSLDR